MKRTKIIPVALAACALAVGGSLALSACDIPAPVVSPPVATPTTGPTAGPSLFDAADSPDLTDEQQKLYSDGAVAFDRATSAFPLSLPDGYVWPRGRSLLVTPDGADQEAFYVWIAANANAARDGDGAAAASLRNVELPMSGVFLNDVRGLIDAADYTTLLKMFPLPRSMQP